MPRRYPPAVRALKVKLLDFFAGGPRVARLQVACSGGVDSLSLLDALTLLPIPLRVVTVDHGLRAASASECDRVLAFAAGRDVPAERVELRLGSATPAAARAARYEALLAAARRTQCDAIAVAHHADDQLETLLDRVLRGASLRGLAAMRPRRPLAPDVTLLRPLLGVTRAEITAYAEARGLDFVVDPSNADRRYRRTRLRDALRGEHPQLAAAIVGLTERLAEDADALDWASASIDPHDRRALLDVPRALRRRAVERLTGPLPRGQHEQLERLLTSEQGSGALTIAHGRRVVRTYDRISLEPLEPRGQAPAAPPSDPAAPLAPTETGTRWRPWQQGDRIKWRGHTRLLSDLFINAKLPRTARARVTVEVDAGGTICAIAIPDESRPAALPPLIRRDAD